jgi:hypothetical protein
MHKSVTAIVIDSEGVRRELVFRQIAKVELYGSMLYLYDGDIMDTIHKIPNIAYWSEQDEVDWGDNMYNRYAD